MVKRVKKLSVVYQRETVKAPRYNIQRQGNMRQFTILARESLLRSRDGQQIRQCLSRDTIAFYHSDYHPGNGRHNINGTIENIICTLKNDITPQTDDVLRRAVSQLSIILRQDLPQILRMVDCDTLYVCVIPRAKRENFYDSNQKLFRTTIRSVVIRLNNFSDGTNSIIRHTDTITTHRARSGHGGNGSFPYCGITNDTCNITGVRGKNILLIDDLYTKTVGIDEDAIQALYDNGANKVIFYSIGKTVSRF